jgi:hypothetical protein
LTKLTDLYLSGNPIAPKTCPLKPESICKWEPIIQPSILQTVFGTILKALQGKYH